MGSDEMSAGFVTRAVAAAPSAVWSVLADGWVYATWVVGASRVRAVDQAWPAPGSRIHHSVGVWPLLLDDTTSVEECTPDQWLVLRARGWPFGEARVILEILPQGSDACLVRMAEDAVAGPGQMIPGPARQALIRPRNVESLRRLALLAEGRAGKLTAA